MTIQSPQNSANQLNMPPPFTITSFVLLTWSSGIGGGQSEIWIPVHFWTEVFRERGRNKSKKTESRGDHHPTKITLHPLDRVQRYAEISARKGEGKKQ